MTTDLNQSVDVLNRIFTRAYVHVRAHATEHMREDAIRIIYRGCVLADPKADLKGDDRRRIASAFIKAGYAAGEYWSLLQKSNTPSLYMEVYTPPADMLWVTRDHINPWSLYIMRPELAFIERGAEKLVHELVIRYPNAQPQKGQALVNI